MQAILSVYSVSLLHEFLFSIATVFILTNVVIVACVVWLIVPINGGVLLFGGSSLTTGCRKVAHLAYTGVCKEQYSPD